MSLTSPFSLSPPPCEVIIVIVVIIKVNKCLNITSEETGACVLLRAAMPLQGSEVIFIVIILIVIVIIVIVLIVIVIIEI